MFKTILLLITFAGVSAEARVWVIANDVQITRVTTKQVSFKEPDGSPHAYTLCANARTPAGINLLNTLKYALKHQTYVDLGLSYDLCVNSIEIDHKTANQMALEDP